MNKPLIVRTWDRRSGKFNWTYIPCVPTGFQRQVNAKMNKMNVSAMLWCINQNKRNN